MPAPIDDAVPPDDGEKTIGFLRRQTEQFGGNVEIESNVWALFVVAAGDPAEDAVAQGLLADAPFAYHRGESEDDEWVVYCVDAQNQDSAAFWADDLYRKLSGRIRNLTPSQMLLVDEMIGSAMPHRIAKNLADLRLKGEVGAGAIRQPEKVRGLLDRLHGQEPLFFSAFQTLLEHQLIDLLILNRKLVDEDVRLENDLTRGSLSRDPFFQARQMSAAQIRDLLVRCQIINPIDQQKSPASNNPYVFLTDTHFAGDEVLLRIDGIDKPARKSDFLGALRMIRRGRYGGTGVEEVNTQTPWVTEATAYPLRFIKQRINSNRGISEIDWLYMLERAVDPDGRP